MKATFLFLLLFSTFCANCYSQDYIFGKILSEDGFELGRVVVLNMSNENKTVSDKNGTFMLKATAGDEIRFVKPNYERQSLKISAGNFNSPLQIALKRTPELIEEVNLKYQVTGNLKEDAKAMGDRVQVKALKGEIANYISRKSDASVLRPKHNEFVQPVGPGFSIGKVKDRWDDIDFMQFLVKEVGEDYFTEELKLEKTEIEPFIFFVFRNFERKKILKFGQPTQADISRFMSVSRICVFNYKNKN